jgi:hypothetical protein
MISEVPYVLVALTCAAGAIVALQTKSDPFHPLIYLGAMLAYFYSWVPLQSGVLDDVRGLSPSEVNAISQIYMLGVAAVVLGCLWGGRGRGTARPTELRAAVGKRIGKILWKGGTVLGGVGILSWIVQIATVGGFRAAYSRGYGGGWHDSGYVRDATLLVLPAIILMLCSGTRLRRRPARVATLLVFALPLIVQGLLGARRGPTFMIVTASVLAWYLARHTRPSLTKVLIGGLLLGGLIVFLVGKRSEIYLGSDLKVGDAKLIDTAASVGATDYRYGLRVIARSIHTEKYYWGKRYLAQVLVRPIPRQIWPNKYSDFGVPELESNAGTAGEGLRLVLGVPEEIGAAPGLLGDLWVELSWLSVVAAYGVGWIYGRMWKNAVTIGGFWNVVYCALACLSIYVVMQTIEAVIFRFLIVVLPAAAVWHFARPASRARRGASLAEYQR